MLPSEKKFSEREVGDLKDIIWYFKGYTDSRKLDDNPVDLLHDFNTSHILTLRKVVEFIQENRMEAKDVTE